MGRIVQKIPLRGCHLGNGIAAEIQQAAGDNAVFRDEGFDKLTFSVANSAVGGHDVLLGPQLKHCVCADYRLAGFLVCLGDCNRPHLRGIVQRQAFAYQLHRLPAICQCHIVRGGVQNVALRGGDLGNGIGSQI